MDNCNDNRFEIIEKAKQDLLNSTNIDSSKDEMKVLDNFLFRCWQMGWLKKYNLTSDAEGDEMLTVPRMRVVKIFVGQTQVQKCAPLETIIHYEAAAKTELLYTLFGPKCLPDNVDSSKPNVDSLEPKPDEPKFKVGDKVKDISSPHDDGIYKIDDIKKSSDGFIYHIQGLIGISNVKESDLEPYTEPEADFLHADGEVETSAPTFTDECKSQCKSRERLQIAAMAMQGILSNADRMKQYGEIAMLESENLTQLVARNAMRYADALIAEAEKGGEE